MGVEFVGYAGDCRIFGRVPSLGERLTDLLNAAGRVVVRDARLESLVDGHALELPIVEVDRDELFAVVGHGPRGTRSQRVETDAYRIRVGLGPYVALGNLHTPPDTDPVGHVLTRPPMIPLTNATIAYALAEHQVAEDVGTIIVNRVLAEWIAPVGDEAAQFPNARVVRRLRLKDFTELRSA